VKVVPEGNLVALKNVGDGGKGSTVERSVAIQLETREASPGSCPKGITFGPRPLDLSIVDDDGDVVFSGSKKSLICTSGERTYTKFGVRFQGPQNCKDSTAPAGQVSTGDLFVDASTTDGSYSDIMKIQCKR